MKQLLELGEPKSIGRVILDQAIKPPVCEPEAGLNYFLRPSGWEEDGIKLIKCVFVSIN